MPACVRGLVRKWLLASVCLSLLPLPRISPAVDLSAVVFETIDNTGRAPWELRLAFWQDPDLSEEARVSRINTLTFLARKLKEELGPELMACNFGRLSVYLIDDYQVLLEARQSGESFELLHCDQAVYVMGKEYLVPGLPDPYELLVEEIPVTEDSNGNEAGIWVREDSPIKAVKDLPGKQGSDLAKRHVAVVDDRCLLGGALQRARLHSMDASVFSATGEGYTRTSCGSVSDAILRLLTGLSSGAPIEAAFLPVDSPGFRAAREALGLRRKDSLPIRLLAQFQVEDLPGRPLLANRFLRQCHPDFLEKMEAFFERQQVPYRWKATSPDRYSGLEKELSVLFESDRRQP